MARASRLRVERLDDRCVPAAFGVPWVDPRHLTLSFVLDGTSTSNGASDLYQSFGTQLPQMSWQGDILLAVQSWVAVANLNVGVVADGSEAFGVARDYQGDSRFGDIRIGGAPMPLSTLALATPPSSLLSGTMAGEILFNTSVNLTDPSYDLYSVALHEVGHALGLSDNTDPTSVMFGSLQALPSQLSAGDIAAIQALYGSPLSDPNAVPAGTSATASATSLLPATPNAAAGQVPLVAYGDLTTTGSTDAYAFSVPQGYTGPMTVRVRTAGISLLDPTVSLYDPTGALVATGSVSDPIGGEVVLPVSATTPGATYSLQISGAGSFGTGRYSLAVAFNSATRVPTTRLESVLQGPYDTWAAVDVANLLVGVRPSSSAQPHNTPATAMSLTTTTGTGALPTYQVMGLLHGEGAIDYYQIVTPNTSAPPALSVAVAGFDGPSGRPSVKLFDSLNQAVPAPSLVNSAGTYAVQATGLAANQTYFIRVSGGDDQQGGYVLAADFNQPQIALNPVATGQLTPAAPSVGQTLFVAKPQYFLFSLALAAEEDDDGTLEAVQMTIRDATGATVFSLTSGFGRQAASGIVLLAPGQYSVQFTGPTTGVTQTLTYALRLASMSDPVGPRLIDPADTPLYQSLTDPNLFIYPVGIQTTNIFLWFPALY
jgi:hypothetical protein